MTDTEATDTDPDEAPTPQYLPSAEVVGNLQTYLARHSMPNARSSPS